MRKYALLPYLAALLALIADRAAAAGDADSADPLVISATRLATPESQLASSITIITAEDIAARQNQTLPDVLRDVPGLNLVQVGGPGGQTSIFMRGTNDNHTKVLVDGIDVTDPSSPTAAFDFGQFPAQDIERIEVLRGPQSGLYGSDAIGGVINIVTRSGAGPAQLAAGATAGSFETFNQSASVRGQQQEWHYAASLEHLHAGATPVTPPELLAPGEARNDDYYDNLTASTKLGYDVKPGLDLSLVGRYTDSHLRFTDQDFSVFPSIPAAQQSATNLTQYYARLAAHSSSPSELLEQTLGLAYNRDRSVTLGPDGSANLASGNRTKLDWQGALHLAPKQTLLLGAEHERDAISTPLTADMSIDSGFAELQSSLGAGWFSAVNVRYDANNRFSNKATYRLAPAYQVADTGLKLKASIGSGFKAPTLSELFQNFPPFFFANPHLRPESSVGYDAGAEQTLWSERLKAGVTYFHNHIHDLITTDSTGTTYANIGEARTQGIESFLTYRASSFLSFRTDYTYTEATDDVLHEELLRRPKHKASLNADWR